METCRSERSIGNMKPTDLGWKEDNITEDESEDDDDSDVD